MVGHDCGVGRAARPVSRDVLCCAARYQVGRGRGIGDAVSQWAKRALAAEGWRRVVSGDLCEVGSVTLAPADPPRPLTSLLWLVERVAEVWLELQDPCS